MNKLSEAIGAVPYLSRLQGVFARKNEEIISEYPDLAIDLGTATGLISNGERLGEIKVTDLKGRERKVNHIRTLVALKRSTQDLTDREFRQQKEDERNKARSKSHRWVDNQESDVEAIGQVAFERWGRAPQFQFERAVRRGNIGDPVAYRAVMRYLVRVMYPHFKFDFKGCKRTPRILIGVPRNATSEHLRMIISIIRDDLWAEPVLVWEQIASTVGARLRKGLIIPYDLSKARALADIGGGTIDYAVVSKSQVVDQKSSDTAGDEMDLAIMHHLGEAHNVDVGFRTAIEIKEEIGSAVPNSRFDDDEKHEVSGSSFETQKPATAVITRKEIRECLQPVLKTIVKDFENYLESLHPYPDVHRDIKENGFYLTGGGSLLSGLDAYLAKETGLKIQPVENALTSVIDGLALMLNNNELLQIGKANSRAA